MRIQFIRHATHILIFHNKKILVDPMLNPRGSLPAIENVPNTNNNPLIDLPMPIESIINCDAILVTHTHSDHFNNITAQLLPKQIPIFCQPEDEAIIKEFGFIHVNPVKDFLEWEDIKINRTQGKHGHGAIALKMAPVSGYIISAPNEPRTYLMGDTVWCSYTKNAIKKFLPEILISYCGEARFSKGKPITMNAQDILSVCKEVPGGKVVAVHMEAWNHCRLTRKTLREFTISHEIARQVLIPADGDIIDF